MKRISVLSALELSNETPEDIKLKIETEDLHRITFPYVLLQETLMRVYKRASIGRKKHMDRLLGHLISHSVQPQAKYRLQYALRTRVGFSLHTYKDQNYPPRKRHPNIINSKIGIP